MVWLIMRDRVNISGSRISETIAKNAVLPANVKTMMEMAPTA